MRRMVTALIVVAVGACVDVPDGVRAQFAEPAAVERSNYRPGRHGATPPASVVGSPESERPKDEPPSSKSAETGVPAEFADAGAAANSEPLADGGLR